MIKLDIKLDFILEEFYLNIFICFFHQKLRIKNLFKYYLLKMCLFMTIALVTPVC